MCLVPFLPQIVLWRLVEIEFKKETENYRGYLFTQWGFRVGLFELDFRVGLSSWTFEFGWTFELDFPTRNPNSVPRLSP